MDKISAVDSGAAKQFLLAVVVDQAARDGVELSSSEKKLFLFSESAGAEETENPGDSSDDEKYEAKIAKLLRHAYVRDKRDSVQLKTWNDALEAVRNEDFYGLVMVDQARISRPSMKPALAARRVLQFVELKDIFFGLFALAMLGLAYMLVGDRLSLVRSLPDWEKLVGAAAAILVLWQVSKIYFAAANKR